MPVVDEFMRLYSLGEYISTPLPVISDIFNVGFARRGCKKLHNQFVVSCAELFSSNRYVYGTLQCKFQLSRSLKDILLQILVQNPQLRQPLQIEQ